jgi:hypothetical protein
MHRTWTYGCGLQFLGMGFHRHCTVLLFVVCFRRPHYPSPRVNTICIMHFSKLLLLSSRQLPAPSKPSPQPASASPVHNPSTVASCRTLASAPTYLIPLTITKMANARVLHSTLVPSHPRILPFPAISRPTLREIFTSACLRTVYADFPRAREALGLAPRRPADH